MDSYYTKCKASQSLRDETVTPDMPRAWASKAAGPGPTVGDAGPLTVDVQIPAAAFHRFSLVSGFSALVAPSAAQRPARHPCRRHPARRASEDRHLSRFRLTLRAPRAPEPTSGIGSPPRRQPPSIDLRFPADQAAERPASCSPAMAILAGNHDQVWL